ncbi:MAG: sulfotransferase, partial [Myxococcota bacterium]|nr:sulfotransferase [Myxococcota bacterium]
VLASIHPWDAEGPDEEIMLCEHTFKSWVPESFMDIPGYIAWLSRQDLHPTYAYLERMLKFLQWQKKTSGRSAERWVLKAPFHLGYGDVLFETFPSARVIQTHRDPCETMPSIASMAYALWGLGRDEADPLEVGRQAFSRWSQAVAAFVTCRDTFPPERFFDCDFRAVGADPIGEIARIYDWLNLPLEAPTRTAMEGWLTKNARDKRAPHEYSLETFGLTRADIETEFADYRKRFDLAASPPRED